MNINNLLRGVSARIGAALLLFASVNCRKDSSEDNMRNSVIGLLGVNAAGCAAYTDTAVPNALFSGGLRTRYETSTCEPAWGALGFQSNGSGSVVSAESRVITEAPFSGFGTSVEVTFTVETAAATLDVMAYGTAAGNGAFTAASPTLRLVAGVSCALQFRKNSDGQLANVAVCTDPQTLTVGNTYTYCLDFNRGTASGGSYTGFGNMLAAWSKPCAEVPQTERDQMGDIRLMQMMNVPAMNPSTSGALGFSYSGVRVRSFRVGNSLYSSMM